MNSSAQIVADLDIISQEIRTLISSLGTGKVAGVAYDTAWTARLAAHHPQNGFSRSLEWLRQNQHPDGSWGADVVHHHDRFISTLAAITALREAGGSRHDEQLIKRGEVILWKLVGQLGRDDSDTIGFPILSAALAEEATSLGLDVPLPPVRFAAAFKKKVDHLLNQSKRDWRSSTVSFSLEALRYALRDDDQVLESNHSVAVSPSATAAYLMTYSNEHAMQYLHQVMSWENDGSTPAVGPIDVFEIVWTISHLHRADAVCPNDPPVRRLLDHLWEIWSNNRGVAHSSYFGVPDLDDTAAAYSVLEWAGYPVSADVFEFYERDDHFWCYVGETNPALSAHVRLLLALRLCEGHPRYDEWIQKVVVLLRKLDKNGSFWWDKWHASPYYVNSTALIALQGLANDLAATRAKWIIKTQNFDGGWGYFGTSTPEETAYCLEALLVWDREVETVDPEVLFMGATYLRDRLSAQDYTPLWIGKSLYTPVGPVRSVVLSALYSYYSRYA